MLSMPTWSYFILLCVLIFLQKKKKMVIVVLLAFLESHWLIQCKHVIFLFLAKYAEDSCSVLMSSAFEPCHHEVSPTPYVKNCRFDVCSSSNGKDSLCSSIANYAAACARKSILVQWREPDFCRKWNAPKTCLFPCLKGISWQCQMRHLEWADFCKVPNIS